MTRPLSILTLALVALVAAPAALSLAQDRASAQAAPPRVSGEFKLGVVDLATVFKQYKKSSELEQKINEERDRLRKLLDEQKKIISKLLAEMDALDPLSESYQIKEDEKDSAVAKFDRMKKRLEETIKKRWEEYNLQLLEDIEQVVKAYGEEQRFTLILKVDGKPTEESRLLAGLKTVMYHSQDLDITAPVVVLLNKNFEDQRAKAGKAGAAPSGAAPAGASTPAGAAPPAPAAAGTGKK